LLFPAVAGVIENGNKAKGVGNLRQLVAAGLAFASEHRGYLPNTFWGSDLSSSSPPWDSGQPGVVRWITDIHPYVYGGGMRNSSGTELCDATFRAPGMRGYETYGNRAVPMSWDAIDFVNVNYYRENPDPDWKAPGRLNMANPARVPFLLMGYNDGGSGITSEAYFKAYCYNPKMGGSPPSRTLLPRGTAWVYGDSLLVGYAGGNVEVVRYNAATNMYNQIFNRTP